MNFLSDKERLKELWKYAFVFDSNIKVFTSNLSGEEGEWSVYFAYTKLNDFSCLNEAIVKLIGHIIQKSEGFDWCELEDDYVTKSL